MNRLRLFPDTTRISATGLSIGGCELAALAAQYGTPLYLYDRASLDASASLYQSALAASYPGQSGLTYAGKAWLCLAMAQWTQQHGLWLDCTGQGEIAMAVAAGVGRQSIVVHGVNKSAQDLQEAMQHAGTIVVDGLAELAQLVEVAAGHSLPELWLRFQPGVTVETHAHIQTGQSGSKFGMERTQILEAVKICRERDLPLKGLHFHLGSQLRDPAPLGAAISRALDLAMEMGFGAEWTLSPGGGWGVAYHEDDLPDISAIKKPLNTILRKNAAGQADTKGIKEKSLSDVENYIRLVAEAVAEGCRRRGLSLPRLQLEPGRSLVARAGVAVYRVGTVKRTPERTWVLLDGGLADNPRHALYGARYSALPVHHPERENAETVCLAGPYCESGDVLAMDLPMPRLEPGELIAIPVSGAYQLSMSSNYNGAFRPAVVWLADGRAQLIQRRETAEDLLRRDQALGIRD